MGNILKFEFKKCAKLFLILLIVAAVGNIALATAFGETGSIVFVVFSPIALGIIYLYELIRTYSNELNKTTGYMLFLTPHSGYEIIGAKIIFVLLMGLIFLLCYILFAGANVFYIAHCEGIIGDLGDMFQALMDGLNNFLNQQWQISIGDILLFLSTIVLSMVVFIMTVYASITIRKSLLSNIKFGGLFSFIIFILLNILLSKFSNTLVDMLDLNQTVSQISGNVSVTFPSGYFVKYFLLSLGYDIIISGALLFGSGYLIEHKINL